MSPGEVWWLVRAKMPEEAYVREDEKADLYRMLKEAKAREAAQNG